MKNISFLIKPASSLCNLRCRYCFYEDEAENRMQKSMGVLSEKMMDTLLTDAFSCIEPGGQISFAFQGGEPTMAGLDWFRVFTEKAHRLGPAGVGMHFSIQTNGILLDAAWAEFFAREKFLVGISLDGCKDLHNRNRVDAEGHDTWNRAVKSAALLQKHGVAVNALCVVTGSTARSPEKVYRELKKLGFGYLQFIACLDPIGQPRGGMPWSLTPAAYGTFLCRLFDLWYADWAGGNYTSVRLFEDYVHLLLGDGASTCATCGRCGAYFVVEADGSVYPCDFYALDEWKMETLGQQSLEELAYCETARRFLMRGRSKPEECSHCRFSGLCNGGCPNDWIVDKDGTHNYYCATFQMLLEYAAPRLQRIAQEEYRRMRYL